MCALRSNDRHALRLTRLDKAGMSWATLPHAKTAARISMVRIERSKIRGRRCEMADQSRIALRSIHATEASARCAAAPYHFKATDFGETLLLGKMLAKCGILYYRNLSAF
jgi:hypothetical protein